MPSINRGLVATSDPNSSQPKRDVREAIAELDADISQFSTMLMKLPSEAAKSFKVEWMEDELLPQHGTLGTSANSANSGTGTTFTLGAGEGDYFRVGDIVRIPVSGEAARVLAQSSNSISVLRSINATSAQSAQTGNAVVIVSGSNEQGATAPTAVITQRVFNYNYTSIHRDVMEFAETALAGDQWFGDGELMPRERRKKAVEHKRRIENSLFFGTRTYDTTGTKARHTAGGLLHYISTNRQDAAGTFDKAELATLLRNGLEYGNKGRKVLFCAPIVAQVVSQFLGDNWVKAELANDPTVWGVKVDALISGVTGSRIPVIVKNDWQRFGVGAAGHYGSIAFLVDMENVQLSYLRPTAYKENRQTPDADEQKSEFVTEVSLRVEQEKTHSFLYNVTG